MSNLKIWITSFLLAFNCSIAFGTQYNTIEWIDLLPPDDLEALLNPPEYLAEIEDGSPEDSIQSQLRNKVRRTQMIDINRHFSQKKIVASMDGKKIRIPGFIVPLEFENEEMVIQFFFVPFFGACLHLPPPPPNQIILVDFPEGVPLKSLYTAFWISGELKTSLVEKDIATAAYTMTMDLYEVYRDD